MAFKNIARQGTRPGQLVRYVIPDLKQYGPEKPAFLIERFGPQNSVAIGEVLLKAGSETPAEEQPTTAMVVAPSTELEAYEAWAKSWIDKRDQLVKYCIRGVEGLYHDDENGEVDLEHPAELEDVPSILEALPLTTLLDLFGFCLDHKTELEPVAKPDELAKK